MTLSFLFHLFAMTPSFQRRLWVWSSFPNQRIAYDEIPWLSSLLLEQGHLQLFLHTHSDRALSNSAVQARHFHPTRHPRGSSSLSDFPTSRWVWTEFSWTEFSSSSPANRTSLDRNRFLRNLNRNSAKGLTLPYWASFPFFECVEVRIGAQVETMQDLVLAHGLYPVGLQFFDVSDVDTDIMTSISQVWCPKLVFNSVYGYSMGGGLTSRDILRPNKRRQHGGSFIIKLNGKRVIVTHGVMRESPIPKCAHPKAGARVESTYAHSHTSPLSCKTGITATFVTTPARTRRVRDKCNVAGSCYLFGSTGTCSGRKLQYIFMARSPQASQFQTGIVEIQYNDFMFYPLYDYEDGRGYSYRRS